VMDGDLRRQVCQRGHRRHHSDASAKQMETACRA
jgi:hypothetical protein